MRRLGVWLCCVFLFAVTLAPLRGADVTVAVVDLETVMQSLKATKDAEELLDKELQELDLQKEELTEKLKKMGKEAEALRKQAQNKLLSEAAQEKKAEEFNELLRALRKAQVDGERTLSRGRRDLEDRGARMSKRIVTGIREHITEYAKRKKIDLVLDVGSVGMAGAEMVVYATDKLNITEDIVKIATGAEKAE